MPYLGNTPTTQSFISGTDYFNGTGAQTAFTLSRTVASVNDIQAVVNNVVQVPNDAYTISGTTITFTSAPSAGTQNVYVRYLSTTTQAITPSQGTVSYSTFNSDNQSKLGISGKNRIINGNMTIAQRGTTALSIDNGSWQFPVDRVGCYMSATGSKFTAQQNAGSVTPPAGFTNYLGITSTSAYTVGASEWSGVRQIIEGYNVADLGWGTANAKTVTLSFWVRSSLTGTFSGAVYNGNGSRCFPFTYTINSANTWEFKTVTIVGDQLGTWDSTNGASITPSFSMGTGATLSGPAGAWAGTFYNSATGATSVVATNGATWYITGVQLEVGTQATTFTTAGGSYGAELQLCQRYYYEFPSSSQMPAYTSDTTTVVGTVSMPVVMRTTPSVTVAAGNGYAWYDGGYGFTTSTSVSMAATGSKSVYAISQPGFGAATSLRARILQNDSAYKFSAEL